MTNSVVEHLANKDNQLVMLNPLGASAPKSGDGIDALFVDRENTGLTLTDTSTLLQKAKTLGLFAILRCDGLAPDELGRCADLSPDAVVLPQIVSADQAKTCLTTLSKHEVDTIAQIETQSAIQDLAALMALDVTAFLIGPNDLAADMGYPGMAEHEKVTAAVDDVGRQLAAAGRPFGLPTLTAETYSNWTNRGAQLCYVTADALAGLEVAL